MFKMGSLVRGCVIGTTLALSAAPALTFAVDTPVVLPEVGVNVSGFLTTGITAIGAIAAVAIGGFIAFKVVKVGIGWVSKAFGR